MRTRIKSLPASIDISYPKPIQRLMKSSNKINKVSKGGTTIRLYVATPCMFIFFMYCMSFLAKAAERPGKITANGMLQNL